MVDLALHSYEPERIFQITGFQYEPPEDQQQFLAALQLLQNDEERFIRVDIETDSTSFIDENLRLQQATQISQTVIQGLGAVSQMMETNIDGAIVAMEALAGVLEAMPGSKSLIGNLKRQLEKLIEQAQNPPEPPPPPPDYEAMKIELLSQKQQLEAQIKAEEINLKGVKLQIDGQKAQSDAQLDALRLNLEQQIASLEAQIDAKTIEIKEYEASVKDAARAVDEAKAQASLIIKEHEIEAKIAEGDKDREVDLYKIENERRINEMYAQLERMRVEVDASRAETERALGRLRVMETLLEERRLSRQLDIKQTEEL
jgi:hypothetical protein